MTKRIPTGTEVWIVDLADEDTVSLDVLSRETDVERYNRLRLSHKKRLFIFRRHVREYVLRHYAPYHSIRVEGTSGRPYLLSRRGRKPLYFSYSASGNLCAIGISRHSIGVDIEKSDRKVDFVELGRRYLPGFLEWPCFSRHESWLRQHAMHLWCRMEAYGKLKGIALHDLLVNRNQQMMDFCHGSSFSDSIICTSNFVCAVSLTQPMGIDSIIQLPYAQILKETSDAADY